MTIIMTAKHQITIPKRIAVILGLKQGSMFDVVVHKNRIELIPLETKPKEFSETEYVKLDLLSQKEKGKEKKANKAFIEKLKKGKA